MIDRKCWLDTSTNKIIEIDASVTGSDGEPYPPMDCVMIEVKAVPPKKYELNKPPFDWMTDWLSAYDKKHETSLSKEVLSWIYKQDMG
jgi:hypothetical protein